MRFRKFLHVFLDILFPPLCLVCKKRGEKEFLCNGCKKSIEILNGFYCPRCKRRLPEARPCGVCRTPKNIGERFILAAACFYNNATVRELICALKYKHSAGALAPLSDIARSYFEKVFGVEKELYKDFLIIPIPLHAKKERERGFNQALLIATVLNTYLHPNTSTIHKNVLTRIKNTPSQTEQKNFEARKENVQDCFNVEHPEKIFKKNIFLVDDVYTSGATMQEAVKTVKNAGVKKIVGVVLAKA